MAHWTEARKWGDRAREAGEKGDRTGEMQALRRCVAHLASAGEEIETIRARADANHRLADLLADGGEWTEAMQVYQEATDAYGRIPGMESEAGVCARQISQGVRVLRQRPDERLYLLTARYERDLRNLAVQPGTEKEQADCAFHIGAILHRRERPIAAVSRYQEAFALFEKVEGAVLERGRTAKRLGDLYFGPLNDEVNAFTWYRRAEREFSLAEDLDEADRMSQMECARRLRELSTDPSDIRD